MFGIDILLLYVIFNLISFILKKDINSIRL